MKLTQLVLSLFACSVFSSSHAENLQLMTYITDWTGTTGYAIDGSHPSAYHDNTLIKNQDMVEKSQKSDVLALAFFQVWSQEQIDDPKYKVPASYLGKLHFSDLWADLPSVQDTNNYPAWKAACASMGDATCSTIQLNGMTQALQLFNYNQTDVGQMNGFGAFLHLPSNARKVISIGGANTAQNNSISTKTFQTIFLHQATFLDSLKTFMNNVPGKIDGVDYDFEPPIDGQGQVGPDAGTTADYQHLAALLDATRSALGPDAYISVTITSNELYLDKINSSVEGGWFKHVARTDGANINAVNIMTYDMHGQWSTVGDPGALSHSMLKHPAGLSHTYAINYGIEEVMDKVLSYAPDIAPKLQVGLATYGREFKQVTAGTTNGFDQAWVKASDPNFKDVVPYRNVQSLITSAAGYEKYDIKDGADTLASYLYNPTEQIFIGYVSPAEVDSICSYAKGKGLGGAILWSMDTDLRNTDTTEDKSITSEFKGKNCQGG